MTRIAHRRLAIDRAAAPVGLRSVDRVEIARRGDQVQAFAHGIVHRYPRTVRVPLPVATRLVAAGAPLRVLGGAEVAGSC